MSPGADPPSTRIQEDLRRCQERVQDLDLLLRQSDARMNLLIETARGLRPGMSPAELGETLLDACIRPFNLTTYLMALMDWGQDRLSFPCYWEAGSRRRTHPSRSLSESPGLLGKVLASGLPLHCRTFDEQAAGGVVLSRVEADSGVVPQTWYGVPLSAGERPFGAVSFQSYLPDVFSDGSLRAMDALGSMLAIHVAYALRCSGSQVEL